jgi:hypothetical protein
MERLRPKIKLKGAANNKAADSVESERSQDQFRGAPANPDANVGQGEGFFPVLTGGIKRKRGPRTGERRTKEKQRFTFSRGSAVPSVPGDEEEFSDQDENESKEDVEVDVKMTDQRQVTTASNGLITESVEVKGAQSFQQKQGHLKVRVKASKLQEGSSTSEKQKVNDNENANSPEALKECQKPDLKQLEKPSSLMLKAARSLDQPSTPRQSRSSKSNEMASSPHQNEIEKLHINSENQEKDMVEILEGLHQRHRRQSHAVEKGQNDQSEYNAKELKDALMVVKKIMKMDAAEPFNTPVNPVALGIPDYFDIIDTPMDLGTVCSALERGEKYMNSRDVFKDIQFIWENCYKYNSKGDPILDLMKRVKKNFVKYWTAAGLYYESPKRTTETEHEGGDNPDGNEDPQSGKTKFIESVQSCLRSPKSRDEQVEQVIPMSEAREQVYDKNVEATQVQQCVKELDTEMDILQPPQTDPVVKTKGMKLRFKKSKSEHEQEKTASITEKTDGISIGTDEESGPKVGDSAQSFEEDAQQKDLNVKAKTRRRHGKYHHKDGCLCAVCNAKRRRHEREENAQLAKNQSTMVDVDLSEKMKEKVSVFLEKPLGEQGRTKPEYASNTNLIAKPEEQEHKAKVETRKHKVKAELKDEQESYTHEGRETHGKESRKAQLQVEHGLQMQWENEEQKKESETQQEEDEKESLMQEADEEQQQEGKDLQNQDEVQQEEARGKMQEEAGTPLQEGDIQQEGEFGRCYPADYEIPVQYASPSIMQICEVLFTRNHYSVWNRAHSLTCEPSKTISENKILAAISTLME